MIETCDRPDSMNVMKVPEIVSGNSVYLLRGLQRQVCRC